MPQTEIESLLENSYKPLPSGTAYEALVGAESAATTGEAAAAPSGKEEQ